MPSLFQRSSLRSALGVATALLATNCAHDEAAAPSIVANTTTADAVASDLVAARAIAASDWANGKLTSAIIPVSAQRPLPNVVLGGAPFVKSNNPESFTSTGWLTQHAYAHPSRGGSNTWLSGSFNIFTSHYNKTGSTAFMQIILVNPHSTPVTITYRGAITGSGEAGDANGVKGRSNYYLTSEKLLTLPTAVTTATIPANGGAVAIAVKQMNNGGSIEGTFFVTAAAPGVFSYVVATATNSLNDALALAHNPATRRPATGNIERPSTASPFAFGKESGVYGFSNIKANVPVPMPTGVGNIGLSVNIAGYGATPDSPYIQTSPSNKNGSGQTLRLTDSALRTACNYGHEYNLTLVLQNPVNRPRKVRVWFAANSNTSGRGLTFNSAMQFNSQGPFKVLTYDAVPKQELTVVSPTNAASAPLTVGPNGTLSVPVRFFTAGLSSAGSHFILETQD